MRQWTESSTDGFDELRILEPEEGTEIEYGVVKGNSTVVLIKSGAQGDCRGKGDKYLHLARHLHEMNGCTVLCAPNPNNTSFLQYDEAVLTEMLATLPSPTRLYFVGNSNGAFQGLHVAVDRFPFVKLILVNMPLMINYHHTKEALFRASFSTEFVFGERDPSYPYLPFLQNLRLPLVKIRVIAGADHQFRGMEDVWNGMADTLFD